MKSHLERLEHRDVPAALWQPDMHVGDWVPFPDWSGNVYHLHADVTGPESNGVKVFEDVYFAGEGAGARVLILDGGRAQYVPHYDPVLGEVWSPEDKGRVLFDGLAFGDATARFGLKAAAVTVPLAPSEIAVPLIVTEELDSFALAIEPASIAFVTEPVSPVVT